MELDPRGRSGWAGIAAKLRLDHGDYAGAVLEMRREPPASLAAILPLHERGVRMQDFFDLEGVQTLCEHNVESLPRDAILHAQLGAILEARGRFGEALAEFRAAHSLGTQPSAWRQNSRAWLERAERWATLERTLRQNAPRDAKEAEAFGRIEFRQGRFEESARWFAAAFDGRREQVADFSRLETACAAMKLAEGRRAQGWFEEDLDLRARQVAEGGSAAIAARRVLGAWLVAAELEGVREEAGLAGLPESERERWQKLWASAAEIAERGR
jgi:tetratricopeptide (TPR) repeat protein